MSGMILESRSEAAAAGDSLMARARRGEVAAFGEIYRLHAGRVYALCLRMTSNPSRAEELTHDVFIRVFKAISSFRGESLFTSWLHRVTVSVVIGDHRRRSRRPREVVVEGAPFLEPRAAPSRPGAGIDLERAMTSLPAGARQVFVLHDIEGYKHSEIASILGVAEGTSKAQLHRARRLLRERLQA